MKFIFAAILIALSFLLSVPSGANAQSQSLQVQGLSIDPFLIEIDMAPGQTQQRVISLTNTTNKPLTFTASINDFEVSGNSGQPRFLDSDEESNPKYSLSRWITVSRQPQFTIPPQGQTEVGITITVPSDAEPGTHYGGILFGQPYQPVEASGAAVQHKAGTIILVKLGQSQEKVQITNFFTQQRIYRRGPVEFIASVRNFGDVHAKPKGDITIRNLWGVHVAQVPVNPDALIVLPESARDFAQTWQTKLGFGRYTAEAVMYYGNPKLELRAEASFWIIPVKEIVMGMLITLILGIIGYIGIRKYNQYIIKHSRVED
jgi:hypothetical protein